MLIHLKENTLFDEWRLKREGFVSDGVVDEEAYFGSSHKLLFVLKEVNDDPDSGGWDLRKYLREEGGRPQTWDNITRWIEGIRRLPEDLNWNDLSTISSEKRMMTLRSIAAVNLKKSPGGHTADTVVLGRIAEEDKAFLNRQFELYDPDIIVCCGTSDSFHWLANIAKNPAWKTTTRGINYHERSIGKYVVDYSHPMARCAPQLLYYGLIDAMREILHGNK